MKIKKKNRELHIRGKSVKLQFYNSNQMKFISLHVTLLEAEKNARVMSHIIGIVVSASLLMYGRAFNGHLN